MSLKKSVFDYMNKHPKTSIEKLIDAFSDQNRSTVRKYYYDYSKSSSAKPASKASKSTSQKKPAKAAAKPSASVRQQVIDMMKSNPDTTIDDLCHVVKGASRKTIRDYRNKWIKANEPVKPKQQGDQKNLRQKVYKYLNENPTANLNDLKKVFSDHKRLVTDFRAWKQKVSGASAKEDEVKSPTAAKNIPVESDKQKIRALTTIIEKQKDTIEKQKAKIKHISSQLANSERPGVKRLKKIVDRFLNR